MSDVGTITTDERVAALRAEADAVRPGEPGWYFATWLVFFIDAHASALAAWQESATVAFGKGAAS